MEQITLPAVIDSLATFTDFLDRHSKLAGLDERSTGKLILAVEEILTNIALHGYAENGLSGDIDLRAEITPDALIITSEDASPAFDPRTIATPSSLDKPVEERPIGGLGIYLMLRSVDRFDYAFVDGKNRNVFVVNRPKA